MIDLDGGHQPDSIGRRTGSLEPVLRGTATDSEPLVNGSRETAIRLAIVIRGN